VIGTFSRLRDDLAELLGLEDYLLLAAVVLLPWAFGGVELWAFRTAALLIVLAAGISLIRSGWSGLGRDSRWLLPALLLALWAALQLVPLPAGIVATLSPRAAALYGDTFPDVDGASGDVREAVETTALALVPEVQQLAVPYRPEDPPDWAPAGRWSGWHPLSLLPSVGLERLHWYLALLAAFLLVRRRCRDPEVAAYYRAALFGNFSALAVVGLLHAATTNGKVLWIRETLDLTTPFGPYVNPSNFAGAMELATPWLAGYALWSARRSRALAWLSSPASLLAVAVVLCSIAALATASKISVPLILASFAVLGLLAATRRRSRLLVIGGLLVLVVVFLGVASQTRLGQRTREFLAVSGGQLTQVDRVVSWGRTGAMLRDYPLTGSGFGSFQDVFPGYMPAGEHKRWNHAHNDYLEVLAEGGLVAGALLLWLAWGFWSRVLSSRNWSAGSVVDLETAGLLLALLALSVHAVFDFNHQIPANGLMFTVMAAIAVAAAERRRSHEAADR
jgi:O-antigen ligase